MTFNVDIQISNLETTVRRLEGEVNVSALHCDQLMTEGERYKRKYETELEDKNRLAERVESLKAKNDTLRRANDKSSNLLTAMEAELSVLRNPEVIFYLYLLSARKLTNQ